MGVRGIIRDGLSIYVGFLLLSYVVTGFMPRDQSLILGLVLILLAVWFILERVGILPKM